MLVVRKMSPAQIVACMALASDTEYNIHLRHVSCTKGLGAFGLKGVGILFVRYTPFTALSTDAGKAFPTARRPKPSATTAATPAPLQNRFEKFRPTHSIGLCRTACAEYR